MWAGSGYCHMGNASSTRPAQLCTWWQKKPAGQVASRVSNPGQPLPFFPSRDRLRCHTLRAALSLRHEVSSGHTTRGTCSRATGCDHRCLVPHQPCRLRHAPRNLEISLLCKNTMVLELKVNSLLHMGRTICSRKSLMSPCSTTDFENIIFLHNRSGQILSPHVSA